MPSAGVPFLTVAYFVTEHRIAIVDAAAVFRSQSDIEASYLRQWKEVTARGDGGMVLNLISKILR